MGKMKKKKLTNIILLVIIVFVTGVFSVPTYAEDEDDLQGGGGYSATGQAGDVGFSTKIYDATNGLPTSDANCILGSSDGYIWVGGYGGIMRYDGNSFSKMDTSSGLTSGRAMYEDRKGRIWVGTNDNGIVVIDGTDQTHITYKDGLPASSIRDFVEDKEGNVYVATIAGVCYVDSNFLTHVIDDDRINDERILRLDIDKEGKIYGQTKSGKIFRIENKIVTEVYTSKDLDMENITTIKADPKKPGMIYIGTEGSTLYYGQFGNPASRMEHIDVAPLKGLHWINYDCNRIWLSSSAQIGYLDIDGKFNLIDNIPVDSGIEMMTSDYQGNMWLASSTQGAMKLVSNSFVNVTEKAGLEEEVANVACLYKNKLYIGTDDGLKIIDKKYNVVEDKLTEYLGTTRIRCIKRGADDDLWIATYTNNYGVIHYTKDGEIVSLTTRDGMLNNEVRSITVTKEGTVLAGTNGGIAEIKGNRVINTIGAKDGLKDTVILSVEEGKDGAIYAGTDGDGIYVIEGNEVRNIGRDDGLTSDVVMRIKWDQERDLYWFVTSNSIQYMKDDVITNITSFPNNNNYDIYFDDANNAWITSSYGLYLVNADDLIYDKVEEYRLYTVDNGVTGIPTSQGYCEMDQDGFLYIAGRNGICKVNIEHFRDSKLPIKIGISSIYCGDKEIVPNPDGTYTIPANSGRIRISAAVLDYSLLNPQVQVYMEGKEKEGISAPRSELVPLEYTGLKYGYYTVHIKVLDSTGKNVLVEDQIKLTKKPKFLEHPIIRLFFFMLVSFGIAYTVWKVLKTTVIDRQYNQIKQAKEEAERANTAKTRFLANMSHEIRTPINTIMGMNEMAMREDATGVPKPYFMSMMNYAFDIRNASESLLSLINDLLDMSKIESGKMHLVEQDYDTQDLFRSIVSMIRVRSIEKELTFDVVVDEILPKRLYGDMGKIKQVVLNLLTNAVKYTESGGFALLVSMDEREDDQCTLRISVKDTGIGVKQEDMDKLFSAYERLDEQKNSGIQGTGLGLDISRKFAELMGGSLICESDYGKGSEFILTLPQKITDSTPIGLFTEHDDNSTSGPYVPQFVAPDADVLVVDDNPMNLNVIRGLLKGTKVAVSTASSGEECLERIKDTEFNIVLLDHMMPGMDGIETCAAIRKDYPDLPVYALTANAASGEEFYISKGFNGYLSKPIDSMTLEKTIMKHLPEEIMEKPESADYFEEITEMPENMKWIYDVEGIDVDEGVKNSGGISSYIFGLGLFLDTIEGNAKVLKDSYDEGNIRLYTIKVHSLKSSARIIGAMELSKLAQELEDAGNKEDIAFIEDNKDRFLYDYEAYKEKLAKLHERDENQDDKEMIDEGELKEAYQALKEVVPQMDYDSVEMILDQVSEYKLPEEDAAKFKELSKMLKVFDWDGMEALLGN